MYDVQVRDAPVRSLLCPFSHGSGSQGTDIEWAVALRPAGQQARPQGARQ